MNLLPSMAEGVERNYQAVQEMRREFLRETDRLRREYLDKIEALRVERLRLRNQASVHAGNLGLVYSADTNTFARLVITDQIPDVTPPKTLLTSRMRYSQDEIKSQSPDIEEAEFSEISENEPSLISRNEQLEALTETPQEFTSESVQPPSEFSNELHESNISNQRPLFPPLPKPPEPHLTLEPHSSKSWQEFVGKGFAWLFAVIIGVFVGYGFDKLLELSRFNPSTGTGNLVLLIALLLVGISMIGGIKLLFESAWRGYGEARRYGNTTKAWFWGLAALTLCFVVVEAAITYMAFDVYLRSVTISGESPISSLALFILAFGVASPNLLFSAFQGYTKGLRTHNQTELDQNRHQVAMRDYEAECARLQKVYEDDLLEWRKKQADQEQDTLLAKQKTEEKAALLHQLDLNRIQTENDVQIAWRQHQLAIFQKRGELAEASLNLLEERSEKMETFRKEPEYHALNQCISMINSISQEMGELKDAMNSAMISRGYAGKGLF